MIQSWQIHLVFVADNVPRTARQVRLPIMIILQKFLKCLLTKDSLYFILANQNDQSLYRYSFEKNEVEEIEIDLKVLDKRIKEKDVKKESIEWFLNLRRFGGCYHSGFGLGFERLLMYLTGMENIRDVIPFPRTPGNCDY